MYTEVLFELNYIILGAICLEMYKIIQGKSLDKYLNTFTNLAVPLFTSVTPEPPKTVVTTVKGKEWKWTLVGTCFVIVIFI